MRSLFNDFVLPVTLIGGVLLIIANASSSKNARTNPIGGMGGWRRTYRHIDSSDEKELEEVEELAKNKIRAKKDLEHLKNMSSKTKTKKKKKKDPLTDLMIVKAFFEEEK